MTTVTKENRLRSLKPLMGQTIRRPDGQRLGTLNDVIIDSDESQVLFAVIDLDEEITDSEGLYALRWEALRIAPTGQMNLKIDIDRSALAGAPDFDDDMISQPERQRQLIDLFTYYEADVAAN